MGFSAAVRRITVISMVAVMLFLVSCARSSDSTVVESSRPVIIVGSQDYPPFIDLDNNGDPTGLDINNPRGKPWGMRR